MGKDTTLYGNWRAAEVDFLLVMAFHRLFITGRLHRSAAHCMGRHWRCSLTGEAHFFNLGAVRFLPLLIRDPI